MEEVYSQPLDHAILVILCLTGSPIQLELMAVNDRPGRTEKFKIFPKGLELV